MLVGAARLRWTPVASHSSSGRGGGVGGGGVPILADPGRGVHDVTVPFLAAPPALHHRFSPKTNKQNTQYKLPRLSRCTGVVGFSTPQLFFGTTRTRTVVCSRRSNRLSRHRPALIGRLDREISAHAQPSELSYPETARTPPDIRFFPFKIKGSV